jgi:hypothetical protein
MIRQWECRTQYRALLRIAANKLTARYLRGQKEGLAVLIATYSNSLINRLISVLMEKFCLADGHWA